MTIARTFTGVAAALALAAATIAMQAPAFAEDGDEGEISGEDGALLLAGIAALAGLLYKASNNDNDQPASP